MERLSWLLLALVACSSSPDVNRVYVSGGDVGSGGSPAVEEQAPDAGAVLDPQPTGAGGEAGAAQEALGGAGSGGVAVTPGGAASAAGAEQGGVAGASGGGDPGGSGGQAQDAGSGGSAGEPEPTCSGGQVWCRGECRTPMHPDNCAANDGVHLDGAQLCGPECFSPENTEPICIFSSAGTAACSYHCEQGYYSPTASVPPNDCIPTTACSNPATCPDYAACQGLCQ